MEGRITGRDENRAWENLGPVYRHAIPDTTREIGVVECSRAHSELVGAYGQINALKSELTLLRADKERYQQLSAASIVAAEVSSNNLERHRKLLSADKDRLDWLESKGYAVSEEDDHDDCTHWVIREEPEGDAIDFGMSLRAAIDAAREGE